MCEVDFESDDRTPECIVEKYINAQNSLAITAKIAKNIYKRKRKRFPLICLNTGFELRENVFK